MSRTLALYMLLYFIVFPGCAMAGNILFVNYNGSDNGIPTALSTDGHSVTSVDVPPEAASTYFQSANLNQYCAVVWSAAYAYNQDVSGAVTTLSNWVTSGGHVLITTPDAIRLDGDLISLIGGSGGTDSGNGYSTVANVANSVTTGLVDIRGQQPYDVGDEDSLCAPLTPGTIGLVTSGSTGCPSEPGYTWTLRNLGCGQVAFITSGNFSSGTTNDPDWTLTAIPGHGVYNAGLRNFVYNACTSQDTCFSWNMFLPAVTNNGISVSGYWYLYSTSKFSQGEDGPHPIKLIDTNGSITNENICGGNVTITGQRTKDSITMTLLFPEGGTGQFSGTVTRSEMSGTFTSTGGDSGTWRAVKQSSLNCP